MNNENIVRNGFGLPEEYHGHPGGISRVIIGPEAVNPERPDAINSERLVIHTNEYEVGGNAGHPHAHSNQEQAFYILEGKMEVTVGDDTYIAVSGDTVFLPRNVMHGHRNVGDVPLKFVFISAMLDN